MKGLMDAAAERQKKIAPPLKDYVLRRSTADFQGLPVKSDTLGTKLAALNKQLSDLDNRFRLMSGKIDEIDAILNTLFEEKDSEETDEMEESDW